MSFIYVYDSVKGLYLGYDGQTDRHIWVTELDVANKYENQTDLNITLSLLNTELEPNRYTGSPG